MNTLQGLRLARTLEKLLKEQGYPVQKVLLYGSVALGTNTDESDIDMAVVCEPFLSEKNDENIQFLKAAHTLDVRIETICLHPDDLENRY